MAERVQRVEDEGLEDVILDIFNVEVLGVGPLCENARIAIEPEQHGCVRFFLSVTPVDTTYTLSEEKPLRDSWKNRTRALEAEGGSGNESNVSD